MTSFYFYKKHPIGNRLGACLLSVWMGLSMVACGKTVDGQAAAEGGAVEQVAATSGEPECTQTSSTSCEIHESILDISCEIHKSIPDIRKESIFCDIIQKEHIGHPKKKDFLDPDTLKLNSYKKYKYIEWYLFGIDRKCFDKKKQDFREHIIKQLNPHKVVKNDRVYETDKFYYMRAHISGGVLWKDMQKVLDRDSQVRALPINTEGIRHVANILKKSDPNFLKNGEPNTQSS